jgi:hypothetical protein
VAKKQAVVEGALEVPKDVLRDREMGLTRVVHVLVHLLDCVGNVVPGEGEVLESPSQAAVGSRVVDRSPQVGGDLGLSVDRRGAGLSIAHAGTLEDVPSILALVEEEVERIKVLHRELCWRDVVVCWRRSRLEAMKTMSST